MLYIRSYVFNKGNDMGLRIAIIGGGPGGLTLARILHQHGLSTTVFERDTDALARPQGGTLDLHEESGQLALKRAGLTDEFLRIARYDDQGARLFDKEGRLLFDEPDSSEGNRPEVDRTALRDILLASLPGDCVRWGCDFLGAHPCEGGAWELSFAHGKEGPFDLVVGADGAWSRVRPLLSSYKPQYSGLTFIEFGIDDVDARHPALSRLVGRGKMQVEGDGKAIIAQRNDHAHIRAYAVFRVPVEWASRRFDFSSPAAVRDALVDQFHGYASEFLDLIKASNDVIVSRGIYALPVGHHWQHRHGVTLLGDAAHVMSPFGGEGVNAAMLDAVQLAESLVESEDWAGAVASYEARMFERVIEATQDAADAAATELSHDALALSLEHWSGRRESMGKVSSLQS
jgi:2-polyprenyl-6-methoxyphenol hydroxylase-like FAD-dependent oxidoreductase